MYQPIEYFAKAYQETLLREARFGETYQSSKTTKTWVLYRLLARLFFNKGKSQPQQFDTRDAHSMITPSQIAQSRG